MKNITNKTQNTADIIRELDKVRMAHLFNKIYNHKNEYPDSVEKWLEWLNKKGGNTIDTI